MKKWILSAVIIFTVQVSYAQVYTDLFELSGHYFTYRYLIPLDNKEMLQVEVARKADLALLNNIDTIVKTFIKDFRKLQDSSNDELQTSRVDYLLQDNSIRKFRIQPSHPSSRQFVMVNGTLANLKTNQDTLTITARLSRGTGKAKLDDVRYFRLSFFLNGMDNLENYADLQNKVDALANHSGSKKFKNEQQELRYKKDVGTLNPMANKLLVFRGSVEVQNYTDFLVPSNTIGMAFIKKSQSRTDDIGIAAELHYLFNRQNGELKISKNIFLTLSYEYSLPGTLKQSRIGRYFALSYLVSRNGISYEKQTFRIATGQFSFGNGTTKIQPNFYFHHFLKNVTPALRIVQLF